MSVFLVLLDDHKCFSVYIALGVGTKTCFEVVIEGALKVIDSK